MSLQSQSLTTRRRGGGRRSSPSYCAGQGGGRGGSCFCRKFRGHACVADWLSGWLGLRRGRAVDACPLPSSHPRYCRANTDVRACVRACVRLCVCVCVCARVPELDHGPELDHPRRGRLIPQLPMSGALIVRSPAGNMAAGSDRAVVPTRFGLGAAALCCSDLNLCKCLGHLSFFWTSGILWSVCGDPADIQRSKAEESATVRHWMREETGPPANAIHGYFSCARPRE